MAVSRVVCNPAGASRQLCRDRASRFLLRHPISVPACPALPRLATARRGQADEADADAYPDLILPRFRSATGRDHSAAEPRRLAISLLGRALVVQAADWRLALLGRWPVASVRAAAIAAAGTSIARPQDLVSAINGNPATLTRYHGTQFTVGGAFAGSTFDLNRTGNTLLPGITPFSAKSSWPGSDLPNLGVTQDFSTLGFPVTLGLGVVSTAGGGPVFATCRRATARISPSRFSTL